MIATRSARVESPLGEGSLLFLSMTAREALGRPFSYTIDVLAEDDSLDFSSLLGQVMTVELTLPSSATREFSGHCTEVALVGELGRYVRYRVQLHPWLSLLAHTTNSRIFQQQSVPDVVKQIFRDHGFSDFSEALGVKYRNWDYLVQYRESDLHFVSRLLEQEGIYYYFTHKDKKHTLVLADSISAHEKAPGYEELPYFPPQPGEQRERDHIDSWRTTRQIRPGAFVATDFDFEKPQLKLTSQSRQPNDHSKADYELYDYPGEFKDLGEADVQVRLRLEEHQADYEVVRASSNARGLLTGGLFKLIDFPREDQNKEYLVIEAHYDFRVTDYESLNQSDAGPDYRCQFKAIDSQRQFRSSRITRKPVVEGPQTAIVVGDVKQEIWTDEYGRIKIRFHWDRRDDAKDDERSCWVRVAQIWAGSGFGGIHIPRVGQEVVVDFLEGDPDRPIVTGCLYNADNKPPYTLPANRTQSGIKSRSVAGATPNNFNEIRFEDKKGSEEFHMQAEKTMSTLVKKDRSASVGGSDSVSVSGDRSVSVNGNLSVSVKGNGSGPTQSTHSVTGKHALDASDEITITAPNKITLTVGSTTIVMTPSAITLTASDSQVTIDPNIFAKSSGNSTLMLDPNACLAASGKATVLLDDKVLAASAQSASILLDANVAAQASSGDVAIGGLNVSAIGKMKATIGISGSAVECSPPGTTVSGAMVNVNGNAMVSIAAPMIKIG